MANFILEIFQICDLFKFYKICKVIHLLLLISNENPLKKDMHLNFAQFAIILRKQEHVVTIFFIYKVRNL